MWRSFRYNQPTITEQVLSFWQEPWDPLSQIYAPKYLEHSQGTCNTARESFDTWSTEPATWMQIQNQS